MFVIIIAIFGLGSNKNQKKEDSTKEKPEIAYYTRNLYTVYIFLVKDYLTGVCLSMRSLAVKYITGIEANLQGYPLNYSILFRIYFSL